ncbi:DAK2 domain-containing protein, partial [Kitasatospora nipponensis]|uniref:DAK2 domain-containing protein n=1 Tax=Kitasatospora nipponensis TaxID=258049 RepID=UPI0031D017FA
PPPPAPALPQPDADLPALADALRAGLGAVRSLGGAAVGDKTMVDAFDPAVAALERAALDGFTLREAGALAAEAAEAGARATEPLVARKGRASYLGERSAGHRDPGAASTALLFRALADAASNRPPANRPAAD